MNRAANLSINDIKNIISSDEIKIISFDIFDTLLERPSVTEGYILFTKWSTDWWSKYKFCKIKNECRRSIK